MRQKDWIIGGAALAVFLMLTVISVSYQAHKIKILQTALDRDTRLAYCSGVEYGFAEAGKLKGSLEKALIYIFSSYPKADSKNYARWVIKYSVKYRAEPILITKLICGTKGNHNFTAYDGAYGLTQINWKHWGIFLQKMRILRTKNDLNSPEIAIEAGCAILQHLSSKLDDDICSILKAYQKGE